MRKIRKFLVILGAFTASVLVTILTVEFLFGLALEKKNLEAEWLLTATYDFDQILDENLIFKDYNLHQALKKLETVPEDKYLILLVGDSFTRGHPLPEDQAYGYLLRKKLKEQGDEYEVVNLGVGGYGPDQEYRLIQLALEKRPDVDMVIWQFYNNDIYENISQSLFRIENGQLISLPANENWLFKRQFFYESIPLNNDIKLSSRVINEVLYAYQQLKGPYSPGDEKSMISAEKIELEIKELRNLSNKKDFEFILSLVVPQAYYVSEANSSPIIDWTMNEFQILYDVLQDEPEFLAIEFKDDKAVSKNKYFSTADQDAVPYGTRHFNEAGYKEMSEIVFSELMTKASLSEYVETGN